MQISFFACNKNAVYEYVYTDLMLRQAEQKEAERFYIDKNRFLLHEDIRIYFKWNERGLVFFETPENGCQLLYDTQRMEGKVIQDSLVLKLISIRRECLFLCLLFSQKMRFEFFKTGKQEIRIGKSTENTIYRTDCGNSRSESSDSLSGLLSKRQLCIKRNGRNTEVWIDGRNGIYVNQKHLGRYERKALHYGDELWAFGIKLIWLEEVIAVDMMEIDGQRPLAVRLEIHEAKSAAETNKRQVQQMFSPAPRNRLPMNREPVELEAPPEKREQDKQSLLLTIGPAFTMALPMLLGFGAAIWASSAREGSGAGNGFFMYTGLITAVASALLGSFWAFMNVHQRNKNMLHSEQKRDAVYRSYAADSEQKIREKYRYNRNVLQSTYPIVREYLNSEGNPLLLWNRLETDDDLLTYRLGLGNLDFEVPIIIPKERFSVVEDELKDFPMQLKRHYQELKEVPVCIDLSNEKLHGVIGGNEEHAAGLLRLLALQIAVTNSMKQVCMIFLFSTEKWRLKWLAVLRWLPHVWTGEEHLIAFDDRRAREIAYHAEQLLRQPDGSTRHFIIFSDSYDLLGEELRRDERVSILLFAGDYGELASDCRSIILKTEDFSGWLHLGEQCTFRREILFDNVGLSEAEVYARQLCGMRLRMADTVQEIPKKITIFELLGIKRADKGSICESWKSHRTENSLSIEIGMQKDKRVCYLDAHEKAHGPHGLIAGMTGSGKSEMLQTIVLSISMKFSPEEAGFFLIDYKGGGMAHLFSRLPHLLGSISNLSGSMIYRAMVSIRSENERRQCLFLKNSVNQIHDYQRLFHSGRVAEPLPHIFIIIDEFAELKREEPDFMRELISVAQVGRSLGIHLILATQKPSGTVDDNIWSNARFRICLRVQDRQDSNDMLHRADAAYITNPGCAILQVGNDELFQTFQGAYTMEPYEETDRELEAAVLLDEHGRKKSLYLPDKRGKPDEKSRKADEKKVLQIDCLLEEMIQAAAYMGHTKARPLWLPPLPQKLYYAELLEEDEQEGNDKTETDRILIGRYDHPRKQKQGTFAISLHEGGHHIICGNAACGKSTFLQTILYALLEKETPKTLHSYIIDYSSRLLTGFKESALSGGVFTEEEQKHLPRLFYMLDELLLERKRLLEGGSFTQYQNKNKSLGEKAALPAILIIIDNYGSFREKTGGSFDANIQELSKVGENYGIYLILTASGIGSSELPNRLFENCRSGICLTMNDKYQYCEVLRTSMLKLRLPENIKGRGMAWIDGEILEFQSALCMESENDFERMEKLTKIVRQKNQSYEGSRAKQVPCIPDRPMLSEFLEAWKNTACQKQWRLPAGYEERSGKIFTLPIQDIRRVLVTGKKRTGKKNCMEVMKHAADMCKIPYREITSIEQLIEHFQNDENDEKEQDCPYRLCFIEETGRMINEFYVNRYKRETEKLLCELLGKRSLHKIIARIEYEKLSELSGRKLFEELRQDAYGIHMGGALDSQNIFDFSDIPFSSQCVVKQTGCGTVPKYGASGFYGEVIIPLNDLQTEDTGEGRTCSM